ncbi:MAG: PIN domain-containing protein [Candidatus Latescibacterota bacterium]|jgi:hypothetical protein
MSFWDTSALLPIFLPQHASHGLAALAVANEAMVVWWGTTIEAHAALARLARTGEIDDPAKEGFLEQVTALLDLAAEVTPTEGVRILACRCSRVHRLTAADALQLAAALVWAEHDPAGMGFVCLDERLREAARREGFQVLPR